MSFQATAKRLFDIFLSALGIIIFAPLMAVTALIVFFESGRPIIYCQERVGRGWKPFTIYKFRTMVRGSDVNAALCTSEDDRRVTKGGAFLRKYRIDELPQLFNVLKGDMSFVGPRPEVVKFAKQYPEIYDKILAIRPGITDLASIEFRHESDLLKRRGGDVEVAYAREILPKKLEYNLRYIEEKSFMYDVRLIFMTLCAVFFEGKGIGEGR
jgi:lipopolysaccharide/colanic/teichoic acid biosynthesis glycosyltransferase